MAKKKPARKGGARKPAQTPREISDAIYRAPAPTVAEAMRAFGEPDAFPSSDLGLRKAAGNGHGPVASRELELMARKWRPWRAYAAMALWLAPVTHSRDTLRESSSRARSA